MINLTENDFTERITRSPLPAVVMFYGRWCAKCSMMKPVAEELEKKYRHQLLFYDVDVDESPGLAAEYDAGIVPTFVFFRDGNALCSMQGVIDEELFEHRLLKIFGISENNFGFHLQI